MIDAVVVTGASGFIGRALIAELASTGVPVIAVARRSVEMSAGVEAVIVDDYAATPAPSGAVLVHLAETRDIGDAASAGEAHLVRTVALARLLAGKPFAHRVYVSSAAVCSTVGDRPHRPGEAVNPVGAYAIAKRRSEKAMLAADGTVARIANLYGPGMASNNVIADILRQVHAPGPVCIRDGRPVRDFIWIDDAARGLAAMARRPASGVFNLGTGQGHSVRALAEIALRLTGQGDRPVVETAPAGRVDVVVLDPSATEAQFGWRANTALASGLEILLERGL